MSRTTGSGDVSPGRNGENPRNLKRDTRRFCVQNASGRVGRQVRRDRLGRRPGVRRETSASWQGSSPGAPRGALASTELDESEQRPTRGTGTCWLLLSTDAGVSAHTQLTPARDELRERCGTNADSRIRCREQACGTALRGLLPLVRRGRLIVDCETLVSRSNAGAGSARCLRPGTDDPSPTAAGARRLAGTDALEVVRRVGTHERRGTFGSCTYATA